MTTKYAHAAIAMATALALVVPASADTRPLEVDCSIVYAANLAVAQLLAANEVGVETLGELLVLAQKDPYFFGLLSGLTAAASGGEVYYSDIGQVVPTNVRCGLAAQVASFD